MTRRAPARGRHSKDRKQQEEGLNGQRGERPKGKRQSPRTREHKDQNQKVINNEVSEQKSGGNEAKSTDNDSDGGIKVEEESHSVNGCVVVGTQACDATPPEKDSCEKGDDDSQASVGSDGGPAAESGSESAVGGEGTTAGPDQAASSRQPVTGAGAEHGGKALREEDDDTKLDDAEAASSVSSLCSLPDQAPLDLSGPAAATIAATDGSLVASSEDDLEGSTASSGIMKECKEIGRGESDGPGDRCDSQERDSRSPDAADGLSAEFSPPSPSNSSSNDNSPSKVRPDASPPQPNSLINTQLLISYSIISNT